MRDYLAAATDELTRLEQDVRSVDAMKDPIEAFVRLEALARLLVGQGPVGVAAAAVAHESALDGVAIRTHAVGRTTAAFRGRARDFIDDLHRHRALLRDEEPDSPLRQPIRWHDETSTKVSALSSLRRIEAWNALRLQELQALAESMFPALSESLLSAAAAPTLDVGKRTQLRELNARADALNDEIGAACRAAERVTRYIEISDHRNTLTVLTGLISTVDELRLNSAAIDHSKFGLAALNLATMLPRYERLVSAVRARLLEGPERSYTIDRLCLQLERFERVSLMKNMLEANQPEQPLQEAVDRFVFGEGFYPITHAVAGRGRIDTFFEIPEETLRMRCILIELKQAVKNTTRANVRRAVHDATAQLNEYSKNMRSNPRWALHEVFCVVAYAGSKRFVVNDGDAAVRLVYLGDAPPSARATPLFDSDRANKGEV